MKEEDNYSGMTLENKPKFSDSLPEINLDLIGRMYNEKMGVSSVVPIKQKSSTERNLNTFQEYDPSKPNDYDSILKKREFEAEEEHRRLLEEDFRIRNQTADLSSRHQMVGEQVSIMEDNGPLIDMKIVRMLEKNGWEYGKGKGLGADENGIVNPLIAVKTNNTSGVIRAGDDLPAMVYPQEQSNIAQYVDNMGQSRTIDLSTIERQPFFYQPKAEDVKTIKLQEKFART
jgi:hypothetical protein